MSWALKLPVLPTRGEQLMNIIIRYKASNPLYIRVLMHALGLRCR